MPTRAARSRLGNLPIELTTFIGRRRELAEVKKLLTTTRLLTLTGPGGVGKTRLAVRAASEMARNFSDGAWLVPLASIHDPLLISQSVFSALGMQDVSGRWSLSVLSEYLREKRLLLLLDNCEHLLDGAAGLAGTLLKSCSGLQILATSRQALGMAGETRLRVPPLTLPPDMPVGPSQIAGFDAIALLVERAAAVQPNFTVNDLNAGQVLRLCRQLDGLPLALEIAAARLEGLSVDQLLAGLVRDKSVQMGELRGGEARQRTLQATLDWSYSLLDESERSMWARLSVFADSFDAAAAATVCSDPDVPEKDVPTVLAALVDNSILQRDLAFEPPRYSMLETVRYYARQKLREIGDEPRLQARHRDWIHALAAQVDTFDQRQAELLHRVHLERNNIWTALDFCLRQPDEVANGAEICRHLWIYWVSRGPVGYARQLVMSLLAVMPMDGPSRCRMLWVAASLALAQNDLVGGRSQSEECLALARRLNDPELVAWGLTCLIGAHLLAGELIAAGELAEEALALAKANELEPVELSALTAVCVIRLSNGDVDGAVKVGEKVLEQSHGLGELWFRGNMLNYLAQASLQRGEPTRAEALLRESAACHLSLHDREGLSHIVETLAWTAAQRAANERSATLLGAAERIRESVGSALPEFFRPHHQGAVSAATSRLGEAAFGSAFQRGSSMAMEEAVAYAVDSGKPTKPTTAAGSVSEASLTKRELEIARLIAEGLTNKEVAAKLFISNRTVETHVTNMLNKLGLSSRTQLARWVG